MWKELGYLDRANLDKIQERTEDFIIPHDVGKIPGKIVASMGLMQMNARIGFFYFHCILYIVLFHQERWNI